MNFPQRILKQHTKKIFNRGEIVIINLKYTNNANDACFLKYLFQGHTLYLLYSV